MRTRPAAPSLARRPPPAGRSASSRAAPAAGAVPGQKATKARAATGRHPDREAAIEGIADALGEALGAEVHVRAGTRGFTAQLHFPSADEALEFAARVRPARTT